MGNQRAGEEIADNSTDNRDEEDYSQCSLGPVIPIVRRIGLLLGNKPGVGLGTKLTILDGADRLIWEGEHIRRTIPCRKNTRTEPPPPNLNRMGPMGPAPSPRWRPFAGPWSRTAT